MIFMTDLQTNASNYCLLKIKEYNKPRSHKKLFFIDPGVYELKKVNEYSHIDQLHELAQGKCQTNEYVSIDYPCDMLEMRSNIRLEEKETLSKQMVEKSVANNFRYKANPNYICAIQNRWLDKLDFEFRMKELESVYAYQNKVVALGNMCRIMNPNKYLDHVFNYILQNKDKFKWIHVYGMAKSTIKRYMIKLQLYAPKIIISADSTKWTKTTNKRLHAKYVRNQDQTQLSPTSYQQTGFACTSGNRNEFFLENIKDIAKKGLKMEY